MDSITDYRLLYEAQRRENEEHKRKIFELEAKQRVLECTFRNIKQLRSELSYITKEAESRQNHIHGFLSAFIPEFKNQRIADLGSKDSRKNSLSSESEDSDKSRFKTREKSLIETKKEIENDFNSRNGDRSKKLQHSTPPAAGDFSANKANESKTTKDFDNNLFARTLPPNTKVDNEKSLPLPTVEYNWKERESRTHKIPTYLPRLGYSMYSPSYRSTSTSQFGTSGEATEFDELKLTLKYENESSKNLPTKVELEICDAKTGRTVFRKRQNIYYVKLQENLSSLNSAEDYVLTVTSISGSEKAEEKVTIHNKYYKPEDDVGPDERTTEECEQQMINDIILPDLETALEEFDEEVRFMEETKPIDKNVLSIPKDDIVINPVEVVENDILFKATRTSNIVLRREKTPSPERSPTPDRRTSITSIQSIPKSPLIMMKKPVLPLVSKYRWQNGFRKSKSGQYVKVPLLKLELEFSSEFEFLPTSLQFSLYIDSNNNNDVNINNESALLMKHVKISRNRFLCEMGANECNEEVLNKMLDQTFDGDFMVHIKESDLSSTSASCIIPDFFLRVENQLLKPSACDSNGNGVAHAPPENTWTDTDPILNVDHFKKNMSY